MREVYSEDKIFFNSVTPFIFKPVLKENFPEIEEVVTINKRNFLVGDSDNRKDEEISIISSTFFEVFDFELNQGNTSNPLALQII